MADERGQLLATQRRPISGGSAGAVELPVVRELVWSAVPATRSESPMAQGLRRLRRSTTALVGAAIVMVLMVVAIFADILAPQSPIASDQARTFLPPSWNYPLGTDQLGRDMLCRIIRGGIYARLK